jgi:hypothetical protein
MNQSIEKRNKFWLDFNTNGYLIGENMFKGIKKIYYDISDDQFIKYLKNIHNYTGNPK